MISQKKDTPKIAFTKMHGLGNDFVMLDYRDLPPGFDLARDLGPLTAKLCDRNRGVGADGLIVAAPTSDPARYDIRFIYYNGDGQQAEMCGNGIRCFALFVKRLGLVQGNTFRVESLAGLMQPTLNADGTVTVDMGPPILTPADIPFVAETAPTPAVNIPLTVLDKIVPVTAVSMGNPHCVVFQDDLREKLAPEVFGPVLEVHPAFPAKTNVEFLDVLSPSHIRIRVWERGCGFTLACGTGACASLVAASLLGKTGPEADVDLPGGTLHIRWDREQTGHVFMTGPATWVFTGEVGVSELLERCVA